MNITPRLSADEILERGEIARQRNQERRERWIAFCILVGTVTAFLVLVWALRRTN